MSDTPDRNDDAPSTTQSAARGRLFDTTLYQAWARDADGAFQYLPADAGPDTPADPPGQTWRERVKAGALQCPFPGCDATYTGIRKGAGRVAFVHPKTGTTHGDKQAKETLWRLAAEQTVIRWATTAYPGSTVTADSDLAPNPDLLITTADGDRVAVHLVYSALTAADWTAARDAYAEAGVTPLWLLGNTGPYARKATGAADRLRPPAPVPAALADGAHVAWLNPFLGLIGTAGADADPSSVAVTEVPVAEFAVATSTAAPAASASSDEAAAVEVVAEPVAAAETETVAETETEPAAAEVTEPVAAEVAEVAEEPAAEESESAEESAKADDAAEADDAAKADDTAEADDAAKADDAAEADDAAKADDADKADVAAKDDDADKAEEIEAPALDADEPVEAAAAEKSDDKAHPNGTRPAGSRPGTQRSGWLRRMIGRLRRPAA